MMDAVSIRVPWWKTDLGDREIAAVSRAIRERHVHHGPVCRRFEDALAELLDVPFVVSTTSGSVALLLALLACGVEPGDEVVVPALTFIAPAHAALLRGAEVRLVDVEPERGLVDADRVATAIGPRTRAVVVVHLNGRAADVDAIRTVAAGQGVRVVEDCAQAFRSRGAGGWLGSAGDVAAYSLGITKLITTGEGGFVATRDPELHDRLLRLRNHGAYAIADNRFEHLGANFRLTDMQAAVGLAQLSRLDAKEAGVRAVYEFYRDNLRDCPWLSLLDVRVEAGELPLWTEVLCAERDRIVAALRGHGIETKPFHPCLAESPHLAARGEFPNATRFARRGLTLPSGPDQPREHLEETVAALRRVGAELELERDGEADA